MFNEDNRIYWYLIGLVIIIGVLLFVARDFLIPFIMLRPTPLDEGLLQLTEPPAMQLDFSRDYYATFKTNHGEITVDLFEDAAPNNVNNIVVLSNGNYYAGTTFHRLVPGVLLQGGDRNTLNQDPGDDGFGGPGYFIADEINWEALGLSEPKQLELYSKGYRTTPGIPSVALGEYVLAMASAVPDGNGSQFFFWYASGTDSRTQQLQGQFTVIGRVTSGSDVLNKISDLGVDDSNLQVPHPASEVVLNDVEVYTL